MEMLQCHFILASLLVLNGCFFEASCQTVNTYTTKDAELLPCTITKQTPTVTWDEIVDGNPPIRVLTYQRGTSPPVTKSTEEKYNNFNFTLGPTFLTLDILNVEDGDEGAYACAPLDVGGSRSDVIVEVLVKPSVQYESKDVDVLNVTTGTSYDLTCYAIGARSVSDLSLVWDPSLVVKTPLSVTPSGNYKDYSITSTYTAVRGVSSITCQLTGYVMQDEIDDQRMENIAHTVNLNVQYAPMCNMTIQEGEDCRNVTLICECDAVPADITQYSFFNESTLINDGTTNTFTLSVAFGTSTGFSCNATNDIGSGDQSGTKVHDCNKGTTALPSTTIVTTASLSTNEPTRIEVMGTTTVEPDSKSTDNPESGGLGTGAIVGISFGALAVVIVIVVIALMMFKPGKCGSKSDSSYATDGNSTVKDIDIYEDELSLGFNEKTDEKMRSNIDNGIVNDGMEIPPPIYAEMKKKSDKPDDNGAGPGVDPEIPAYGVIDKNRTKDPTPAPLSSMRDSTNSSKPKQDMEMQYADLDHGNKPPSDKVTKSKEKPTEYTTVHPVIV